MIVQYDTAVVNTMGDIKTVCCSGDVSWCTQKHSLFNSWVPKLVFILGSVTYNRIVVYVCLTAITRVCCAKLL